MPVVLVLVNGTGREPRKEPPILSSPHLTVIFVDVLMATPTLMLSLPHQLLLLHLPLQEEWILILLVIVLLQMTALHFSFQLLSLIHSPHKDSVKIPTVTFLQVPIARILLSPLLLTAIAFRSWNPLLHGTAKT